MNAILHSPEVSPSSWRGASIQSYAKRGGHITHVKRRHLQEFHVTQGPMSVDDIPFALWRLDAFLQDHEAEVLKCEAFGPLQWADFMRAEMGRILSTKDWPLTWVEGRGSPGEALAGWHVTALSGTTVESVWDEDRVVGRIFQDGWGKHCLLGNVAPHYTKEPRAVQAQECWQRMAMALACVGLEFSDLARTWLFLDNILGWYDEFNQVRTAFFNEQDLFHKGVPASTGVGAGNPEGAALTIGGWAVKPLDSSLRVEEVFSPLQCPAPRYGSSFSRAREIQTPDLRRLFVSGTASIDPEGRSQHDGDVAAQIDRTMQVVEAILQSRGMGWRHVSRGTVYFKDIRQASHFNDWCRDRGVFLPVLLAQCQVCRDELLYEIEIDALDVPQEENDQPQNTRGNQPVNYEI